MRRALLQFYRLTILVAIAWVLREHAIRIRIESLRPVTLAEVQRIYPAAVELKLDSGERGGWNVLGSGGVPLGYVIQTAPISDSIVGYRGWTNAMVAFSPELRVLGVRIRSSQDTDEHVGDVVGDPYFLATWNGRSWEEVAGRTPEEAGVEGVSGATMTSMALAEGVVRRLRAAGPDALPPVSWKVRARDIGLAAIVVAGVVLSFIRNRVWLRIGFQILVIGYVGFVNGDLLAQTLMIGWSQNGAPWRTAPGLVLMLAAALVMPWGTGKALYCRQLCPHGHAQELISRFSPKRWRLRIPDAVQRGLRWIAPLTLAFALAVTFLSLPLDLASIEPFDAYVVGAAGLATTIIAVIGLIIAPVVPMGYCHYGCPTGALLSFVRSRGVTDRFGRREIVALALLVLGWLLSRFAVPFYNWIHSPGSDWL